MGERLRYKVFSGHRNRSVLMILNEESFGGQTNTNDIFLFIVHLRLSLDIIRWYSDCSVDFGVLSRGFVEERMRITILVSLVTEKLMLK